MRRRIVAGVVAGLVLLPAGAAAAQPSRGYAPVVGLCIRKVINLPLIDIPDQPIDIMLGGQIDCPPRGG